MAIRSIFNGIGASALSAALVLSPLGACTDDNKPADDVSLDGSLPDGSGDAVADTAGDDVTEDAADTAADAVTPPTAEQLAVLSVPETARVVIPGLTGEVQVLRTVGAIPHIYAENRLDLMRVAGFIQGSDRYFFMDLQRRLGLGTLSSLLGELGLNQDIEARGTGMTAIVDRLDAHISDDFRAYLAAYAEGVNAYIDAVRAGTAIPPTETDYASFLGFDAPADMMSPFAVRDVLSLVAVVMHSTNFESGDVGMEAAWNNLDNLFRGATKEELRRAGFLEDFWFNVRGLFGDTNSTDGFGLTGAGPTTARRAKAEAPKAQGADAGGTKMKTPADMIESLAARLEARARRAGKDREAGFGSNVWAVSGSHAEGGGAILANDGHLDLSIPPLAYGAGLNTAVFHKDETHAPMHQMGGWLGNFPVLIGGTNGKVAFGGVNPVVDITDWYREEIRFAADGETLESYFQGQWKPLQVVEEVYEVATVALLESVGRTARVKRYMTFDGRWLTTIEGRPLAADEEPAAGEKVVEMLAKRIVAGDTDGDDKITAISFDYVGLDVTKWPEALFELGMASNVEEARQATKGFVGSALFMSVIDDAGNAMFTSYQAVPCRGYLPRTDGVFALGADPTRLLDGTTYGGFTIVTDDSGKADETAGADDPYKCVIPLDTMPYAINPARGFVFNANSDPAGLMEDGDEKNDEHYIGGLWASVRANTIQRDLYRVTADKGATVQDLVTMQANIESRLGETFVPHLNGAIARAVALSETDGPVTPAEGRMVALLNANREAFDSVKSRLAAWGQQDYVASSGVETFYTSPSEEDRANSIATMIFNAWFPRFMDAVWNDENVGSWRNGNEHKVTALARMLEGRGPGNPKAMATWDEDTEEGVFFDRQGTADVESSDELMLSALVQALDFLGSEPVEPGRGGFGSTDMDRWLWGLRHMAKFQSVLGPYLAGAGPLSALGDIFSITTSRLPLMPNLADGDPRKGLKWFPRGGDQWSVDAANPGFGGTNFEYGAGAAMRIVMQLKDGKVTGQFIIPGGESGLTTSAHFDDQARLWLANEYLPLLFAVEDVVAGAIGREVYTKGE